MGSRPAMRSELDEYLAVKLIVNYESKKHMIDSKVSGSFSLKIREIERVIVRNPWGRETLIRLRNIGEEKIVYEIPPAFLDGEEICNRFVANVLSKAGVDSLIQQCVVPNISKEAITMNRLRGEEEEEKGFIVEAEAEHVEQTLWKNWLSFDECDPEYRERPIEQECLICLEELSSSSEQKMKKILKLRCGHNFHRDCIFSWLRRKHSCPSCRGDINYPQFMMFFSL